MAARVSVASRVRRWEENQRAGMGESEHGASPWLGGVEKEARERARSCHGVSSGMPGTQLCAWLPGEDDSARGGGLGRLGLALGAR
jgi:hypothetical protein